MPARQEETSRLQFKGFVYEPDSGRLSGPTGTQTLRPQAARLLEALLARPGVVIDRQTLVESVWGEGRVVEFDAGLSALIKELRAALGDQAGSPTFIETIPRRGVRFLVQPDTTDQAGNAPSSAALPRPIRLIVTTILALLLGGLVLLMAWDLVPFGGDPEAADRPPRVAVLPFLSVDDADREQRASMLLADSLIAALGQVVSRADTEQGSPPYAVIGRTSVVDYPAGEELLPRLGRELRVDLVIEGSYRQEGEQDWLINISAVKVEEQTILLSRSFVSDALSSQAVREQMQSFALELEQAARRCGQDCLATQ
ncbi:DNA-binding winged helix-turn-helix (wHTH) protein/TolB-like protein [Natronospira proteinivora]|uniref:DNA-binding winged helix-turn-helix (WHTH) protein/TolB-like protein n=1 Tax=Natronospira proteinivora TaxID=1807133 RepID=A0ABT1G8B9_9GAMM|nr:winged helix-turn-helix domain-containing protein [Natronospira proteinivora]MCP1727559.1 DNA-binding winged helix-turn-helix (wHTH) protein/TolB-like protein [Natronospira proteinivora]